MAALYLRKSVHKGHFYNILRIGQSFYHTGDNISEVVQLVDKDMPIELENPFEKPKQQCILCKYNITPDYKNVRLLSQFVSQYTGRIYGRHITGLCRNKQKIMELEISKSRSAGLMAYVLKDPHYFTDPKLYDPENPLRPHQFG